MMCFLFICAMLSSCALEIVEQGYNMEYTSYNQFIKKLWVEEDFNEGFSNNNSFSFYILAIENGVVEGKLSTGALATPYDSLIMPYLYADFSGMLNKI